MKSEAVLNVDSVNTVRIDGPHRKVQPVEVDMSMVDMSMVDRNKIIYPRAHL